VGLVPGQHHRAIGQGLRLLVRRGQGLVAVGVALGDQPGTPPGRDLAHAPAQRALAGWPAAPAAATAADRPRAWLGQQPQDALAKAGLPSRGRPARGRSESPLAPWAW
jgi:hypothetical protein